MMDVSTTSPVEGLDERWASHLVCSKTGVTAALDQPAFLSLAGAPWLVEYELSPARGEALRRRLLRRPWTLWRYRELLPVADWAARIDLGEGGTPLVPLRRWGPVAGTGDGGLRVWLKEEKGNPSGSFKDRGLTMAVNRARELGAPGVQLASAGNAALALTTYAAAAGLPCRVALPADTPLTVFERCRLLGAQVLSSPGTLVEAAGRLAEFDDGYWNLSTLREPYRAEGKKTMGLELAEQFGQQVLEIAAGPWRLPQWIIYPTGGGTGIVGMHKAFAELERLGLLEGPRPRFAAVQMTGCAPIVRAFEAGAEAAEPWQDPRTEVWGLRVPKALGDFLILRAVRETGGTAVAVEESRLPAITAAVAKEEGLRVGPEGAACLAALEDLVASGRIREGDDVVVFQTGDPANY